MFVFGSNNSFANGVWQRRHPALATETTNTRFMLGELGNQLRGSVSRRVVHNENLKLHTTRVENLTELWNEFSEVVTFVQNW